MKAAAFAVERPASAAEAGALLARHSEARVVAGGQSLGPMLNLRLTQPAMLVPVGHLPDLLAIREDTATLSIGAGVTHAAIADGRVPDLACGLLARIAEGIAYRAVRNRGTIGGSLCHADPAADWVVTLLALNASVVLRRPGSSQAGERTLPLDRFVTGAFRTALTPGEIMLAVQIPRPGAQARWAYRKACRKPGEFAHAMAAVLEDNGRTRAAIGALGARPLLLEDADATPVVLNARLTLDGMDAVARHMQCVLLHRALAALA